MMKKALSIFFGLLLLPMLADVRITEFMADNESVLPSTFGTFEDWIELHNDGLADVDLGGWRLGASAKMTAGKGWTFPSNTVLKAGGYLVVFADKLDCVTNGEFHTNFKLSKVGNDDHLWLVDAAGNVQSDYGAYPQQVENVSYGAGRKTRSLVGSGTPMNYTVNSTVYEGVGRIGFAAAENAGFQCVRYWTRSTVGSVDQAEQLVRGGVAWRENPVTNFYDTIAFEDASETVAFTDAPHNPPPGWTNISDNHDNFAVVATAEIYVPAPGVWTFCVASDDGFKLTVSGFGATYSSDAGSRSFTPSLLQCDLPAAGTYSVNLLWYEQGGGAACEFSVARGSQSAFSTDAFRLVGAEDCPVTFAGALMRYVDTDVSAALLNRSTRVTANWPFVLDHEPAEGDVARLTLRYADGCRIWMNDQAVTNFNVIGNVGGAASLRTEYEALEPVTVEIPGRFFVAGENTLKIVGYNNSLADKDFLLAPELSYYDAEVSYAYFKTATPGAPNVARAYTAPTPLVTASEPRGYKTEAFDVALSCPEMAGAPIYYTLDGTEPSAENGTLYTRPIRIAGTTCLRAAVPDADTVLPRSTCFTWLFMTDILAQSSSATPAGWPASGAVNGHTMRYGYNATVMANDRNRFVNGITNAEHVATISLVTDLKNLFGQGTGIYMYPGNDGIGWERPVSVECIDPVHGADREFQINAGIRIRGAASRSTGNPKHSFRLFFREEYGTASRLNFPLFGDEGADSFKRLDLRSEQNHSWHSAGGERRNTLVRDVFSRDAQREMGEVAYGRSRYYHVFINGRYWGVYQSEERAEEHFAESYMGTEKEYWDVVKKNADRSLGCNNGTLDAYNELFNIAVRQGFSGDYSNNYWKVQGLNPDGSTNLAYKALLNVDNLINYVLISHLTADPDSPVSEWSNFSNNINMLYDETGRNRGFYWLHHDSEHSLGAYTASIADGTYGYPANTFNWGTTRDHSNFSKAENMNPLQIHDQLTAHPAYRRRLADAIQRAFFNNGPLTVANAQNLVRARMAEIDEAVVGEAARWGGGCTRTDWLNACAQVLEFIQRRHPVLMSQYRSKGWLPAVPAPFASLENGSRAPLGTGITVTAQGSFYYTTDGTDPLGPDGQPTATAIRALPTGENVPPAPRTLFGRKSVWSYFDWGEAPSADAMGRGWTMIAYSPSNPWATGAALLGFTGHNGNEVATQTYRYIGHRTSGTQVTTTYFRRTFDLTAKEATAVQLAYDVLYDDGYVLYVNNREVARENMPDGTVGYDTFASSTIGTSGEVTQNAYSSRTVGIPAGLLQEGKNVIAVEVHQVHGTSTDLYWDLALATTEDSFFTDQEVSVTLPLRGDGLHVLARTFNGTAWSALSDLSFVTTPPEQDLSGLKFAEIMHAPNKADNIDPYNEDNLAWLEFMNCGTEPVNLFGCTLTAEKFAVTFGDVDVAPSERFVVADRTDAFALAHPDVACTVLKWSNGSLKRKGDTLTLAAPDGSPLAAVTYSNAWFDGGTYNTGHSLVVRDFAQDQTAAAFSTPDAWKVGQPYGGTPGCGEPAQLCGIRLFADHSFELDASDLETPWDLYFTTNLAVEAGWTLCASQNCPVVNGVIQLRPTSRNKLRPLYKAPQAFFRLVPKGE